MSITSTSLAAVRNTRLTDGRLVDLRIENGVATAVTAGTATGPGLDAGGHLVLPAAVEPHAHLDKALSVVAAGGAQRTLRAAIAAWAAYTGTMTEDDVARRARALVRRYLAHGITAIRTHVDLYPGDDPFRGVRALVQLREELREVVDLQITVLPLPSSPDDAVVEALKLGVDLVGGAPHLADDPAADLFRLLAIAERYGVGVDLHTDENLEGGPSGLAELADVAPRLGLPSVTASHCVGVATIPDADRPHVLARVAEAGIGVVTLPITNLYLMGRDTGPLAPRGLPPVQEMLDAGVLVAAGADNVRDPFIPVGRADPFETASLLVTAAHLSPAAALDLVGPAGRRVMGLPRAGEGGVADLVLLDVDDVTEAAAGPGDGRTVVRRGVVVAHSELTRSVAV